METVAQILKDLASLASAKLLAAVVAAILVVIAGRLVLRLMRRAIGRTKLDPTLQKFLTAAAKVLIYFIAVMIVAEALGFEMSSLVALASVVSAAFALAASGVLSNLFGGILLLITKPFGVGDYISVGGEEGSVLELGLLTTKINTLDNKRVTMPNSSIASATIVNYTTEGKRRVDLEFHISDAAPAQQVKEIIRTAVLAQEQVLRDEELFVRVSGYDERSAVYTLRVWCQTADYWDLYYDLMEGVKAALDQQGIPLAYQNLQIYAGERNKRDGK